MKTGQKVLLSGVVYTAAIISYTTITKTQAWEKALSYVGAKGIVNIGSGCERTPMGGSICGNSNVLLNIDHAISGDRFVNLDLDQPLPFVNKQFDVAFASHILEHLVNREQAVSEWKRVADHVIIVLPTPFDISNWFHPDHEHIFGFSEMLALNEPGVEVYF